MILTPLQSMTKNGEDWGKLIVAKGFKKLPKVQNIAQSGHTVQDPETVAVQKLTWTSFFYSSRYYWFVKIEAVLLVK